MRRIGVLFGLLPLSLLLAGSCGGAAPSFFFVVTADVMSYAQGSGLFEDACRMIAAAGPGSFMISPGDITPPDVIAARINSLISPNYPWIPVVGNHEIDTAGGIEWIRSLVLPFAVSPGPPGAERTCFSFDYADVHFTVINEYYDGSSDAVLVNGHGYLSPALMAWLDADLAGTGKPVKIVVGHEPAFVQPDQETGRVRHLGESLDADPVSRDAFWAVLAARGVKAYICGHTHNYSVVQVNGVTQMDAGHARGTGDPGAPSTFIQVEVYPDGLIRYITWRLNSSGSYSMRDAGTF